MMNILEFDVILCIDWLMAHRVVIDCDRRRITSYTWDSICVLFRGISMMLFPRLCTTLSGTDSLWVGWQALPWKTRQDRSWVYLG